MVIFVLIFCLGIFVTFRVRLPFLLVYVVAFVFLLLSLLLLKRELIFNVSLCLLIFFFAISLCRNYQILSRSHISRFILYKSSSTQTVKGIVNSQPLFQNNLISFILKAKEVQIDKFKYNTSGNILVRIRSNKNLPFACARLKGLGYGEEVVLRGNLFRPFRFGSTSRQSYRDFLYNQNIFSIMNVKTAYAVTRLKQNRGFILKRLALQLKEGILETIFKHVSFVPAAILGAMILGEKSKIPALVNNSMMKTGTVHILVVSGFNVALVASIIILSLRLARVPRAARFYIACPLIIIYCFMTGASTPVVRATIMAIFFMFAYLIRREADIYNSCALAAICILAVNPRQLFDIGFQLSFVSVISIVWIYPKLRLFIPEKALKAGYVKFLAEGFLVSFSAWLGTAGLIAYYFRVISPVTVLANIFIVPLASLATLCGVSLVVMQLICRPLAPFFAYTSELVVSLLLNINALLIKLPYAYVYLT
ncbi:MAG: ComEC/Rec2 family competence protein [Candidatus Omnitrophica bacterium]|nr:ComEC/Rec2 family competence protein [Candidatus Omnitrophota bacterium]